MSHPKRIRVLHVITRLVVGGAQENTMLTVAGLDPLRFHVDLVSGPAIGPEGSLEDDIPPSIRYVKLPYLMREPAPIGDVRALLSLCRLIRHGRYDIVHTHTTKAGILGRIAAAFVGAPIIVHTPHGHAFDGYLGRRGSALLVRVERWLAGRTHRIICLTPSERDDYLKFRLAPRDKFIVIHSGVELSRFQTADGDAHARRMRLGLPGHGPLVGCVARLVPVKGVNVLLEAASSILAEVPDAAVVFVGDGPLRTELQRDARSRGLEGKVIFMGLRRDVPDIVPLFTVSVLPSLNEGMGKAAVEAMAAGRPVVASRVSGLQDVVDDQETGILVTPSDPGGLASAVIRLLRNPSLCETMGRAGRQRAVAFGAETMVERIASVYETLYRSSKMSMPYTGTR